MNEHADSRILVVDDNEQNRALVAATLEDEDYSVMLTASGAEALKAFETVPVDCVLLDVRMPGMDGFEVCRRIRALPMGGEILIVALNAIRDVETFDEALKAGGDDFLTKPIRPAELLIRVKAALELRRLSAENRGYYATIREQRDAVMRLQLQKEQLTAFLVHDLKNPVSALDLQAQLLLRDKALSERSGNAARAIRQEARRLTQLITNMLDISKADAGELLAKCAKVEVAQLVEVLVAEFEVRAQGKDLLLNTDMELEGVHADPELLRRVLENLIDNAIRHAPSGTAVALRGTHTDDGAVELRVSDEGDGVPKVLRESVFEQFTQAGSPQQRRSGYGLGLAFCKLAVGAHGGKIWIEDSTRGAVFCVRLPNDEH